MVIDGATRLAGLLGKDIAYSLSPRIHNASLARLGRNEAYVPFDVARPEDLAKVLDALWALGVTGLNVTQPYKRAVSGIVGAHDMPAVNTLARGRESWEPHATDGVGFERALARAGVVFAAESHWVLLGDGGAAEAILWHAARTGVAWRSVTILSRSPKADGRWDALTKGSFPVTVGPLAEEALAEALDRHPRAVLVQATSAPLRGDDMASLVPALKGFHGVVCDLVYGRHASALLAEARRRGLRHQDGLPMLIEQARVAQEIWWGASAPFDVIAHHLADGGVGGGARG